MASVDLNHLDTTRSLSKPEDESPRWTLSGLEQAFEQALDEAFRFCAATPEQPPRNTGERDAESPIEAQPEACRFNSCDGPI